MTTHPAFEKAIDENPLDSNNHLVYADWLDENGDHEEAAFRRAMGEWVQRRGPYTKSSGVSGFSLGRTHPWKTWRSPEEFPDGVVMQRILTDGVPEEGVLAPAAEDHSLARVYGRGVHWPTYRGMEKSFRRAFDPTKTNYSRLYSKHKS